MNWAILTLVVLLLVAVLAIAFLWWAWTTGRDENAITRAVARKDIANAYQDGYMDCRRKMVLGRMTHAELYAEAGLQHHPSFEAILTRYGGSYDPARDVITWENEKSAEGCRSTLEGYRG